jgi:hypothetical protein
VLELIPQEYQGPLGVILKKLCANKLENLKEMNKFLNTYNLPNLNQEDIKPEQR